MNFTSNEYISFYFLNFLYYADEDQICEYILRNSQPLLIDLEKKYYSLRGHEFNSIVNEALMTLLINKGNIIDQEGLFSFFKSEIEYRLKDRLKYYKRDCRGKQTVSLSSKEGEQLDLVDPVAENDYLEAELLADIKNSKADEITKKYIELIVTSKDKISDLEASRLLGVNVKTIKVKKKIIKNFLITEMQ